MDLERPDPLQHGRFQVAQQLNVELRVATSERRNPPYVVLDEQELLDSGAGPADQRGIRTRRQGGEIGVKSKPGGGSEFTLTLPTAGDRSG